MNKQDLVEAVAKELDTSKAQGERAVNAVLSGISKGVKKDKSVQLIGFGTFVEKKERPGRVEILKQVKLSISRPAGQ